MSDPVKLYPDLTLLRSPVIKPERISPVARTDVERDVGAVGVGSMLMPDGEPVVFLSLHQPDGETVISYLNQTRLGMLFELLGVKMDEVSVRLARNPQQAAH
ncbi:hypothetical protein LWE61_15130 [Sphingobium sufflavum]|uniref:hypothetical protein n=1 Tax=Sphingobium sufflavum TaxID=1129547 RepID=UPI001F2BF7D5|nr:hypothetical protein [Sphingobium sufflavum]MCE7797882.1 hypothetical protein [Sphingobium sufflavum]